MIVSLHFNTEDSQLYLSLKSNDSIQPLIDCLNDQVLDVK